MREVVRYGYISSGAAGCLPAWAFGDVLHFTRSPMPEAEAIAAALAMARQQAEWREKAGLQHKWFEAPNRFSPYDGA